MASDFWSQQRVLVTGGTGFLGRHIIAAIKRFTWPYEPRTQLKDRYAAQKIMVNGGTATLVIHCAANVGGIGKNRAEPGSIMYDNLLMNTHVLHEAYAAGVQKFIGIGSVCAYPKYTPTPFREYNLFNGYPEETNAPYGLTKRALLVMGQAYRQQYGFNAIHLLLANLYGPGDHFGLETAHVIPAMIRRMHEAAQQGATSVKLWGSGEATREFLYVEDAAQAILRAAEVYDSPEPINIGTGQSIRIRDLATKIAALVGYEGRIEWDPNKPDGQPKRELDVRRAAIELGWAASTPFDEGLAKTVDWYMQEAVGA